jgi:N-acyl-phosphatidylethanolamine-hydrolysing phospholipase D
VYQLVRKSAARQPDLDPRLNGPALAGAAASPAVELLYAPHAGGGRFFNPWRRSPGGWLDLLRWRLSKNPYDKSEPPRVPLVANDGAYLRRPGEPASVTWVGHATAAIQEGDAVWLTDPHWGPRALLPRRLAPPGIPLAAVPAGACAVVSHNHYDHLDSWTVGRLPAGVRWYVPLGLAAWFRRHGREATELDWWQSVRHGSWTLTCLPAQHWSNRIDAGRDATLWCSWLLDSGRRRYYFAGDTGYFHGFAELGRRFAPIDVALLPIGAYEPRWFMQYRHMDPRDALLAFRDLRAGSMVPLHWGVFNLTDEPVDLAPRVLTALAEEMGIALDSVRPLAIGERRLLDGPAPR